MGMILLLTLLQLVIRNGIVESNNLDVTDLRLAGGSGPFEGRLEIQVDGVWGTVCDREFTMDEAAAVCRTIDLLPTGILTGAYHGLGSGPVFVQEFNCNGYESDISQCNYESNAICTHSDDVGVICSECGSINVKNGQPSSISANGTVLTITCNDGHSTDYNTSVCENGTWSPPSLSCTEKGFPLNITSMRFVDGVGLADGRVEILVNDTWGTLCGRYIYRDEANVICRMQGFGDVYTYYRYPFYGYGQGTGPVYLSNLECTGTESHINNCTYDISHTCTHYYDFKVVCKHPLNITDIRLVGGTGDNNGRVEVYSNGVWGTFCDRNIDLNDLQTTCRMLNLSFTHQFTSTVYGEGVYPILIGSLGCNGEETTLNDCSWNPPSKNYCDHDDDLTLVCTECGEIDDDYGTFESINGSEITVECKQGYQPDRYKMMCFNNGTWSQEQRCSLGFDFPLNITDIRLQYGYYQNYIPSAGLVELLVNGTWGTICSNDLNNNSANVICHMLGLEILSFGRHYSRGGESNGPIYIENLNCTGLEYHVNECSYDVGSSCTHADDVAVVCTGYHLNITDIRLAGSPGPYQGRVEVEVNGTWGTVGDDYFSSYEGRVVCRMLGLEYRSTRGGAYYGQGSGPVHIDRLNCPYSASHINQCTYSVNNHFNTQHNEDVSVICWAPSLNITDARLVNGTGINNGRVEIKVNDTWGTICDRNFDIYSANLVCNIIGLRAAQYYTGAYYGEGSGPIYIDELHCDGYEQELSRCQYLFLNECTHEMDVSVVCNECGQPDIYYWDIGYFTYKGSILYADCTYYRTYVGILQLTCDNNTQTWIKEGECQEYSFPLNITDIRLVDGPSATAGRVEIKSLDTWGTVCSDGFGISEANAICEMIGYPHAVNFYTSAYYGEGVGPIFVDELNCVDNSSSHINNCSYITYDDCSHERDVSVVCLECGDVIIANGFINSTATNYEAAIKIECDNSYKLTGDSVIFCQLNGSWSNPLPICSLINCGDPVPENGFGNASTTINGTVVWIQCEEGYDLVGDDIVRCQENETWTDRPICQIKDCGHPSVLNADVTLLNNKTTFGETVPINCKTGYEITGSTSITCNSSGHWEDIPTCSIVDCSDPTPIKGFVNKNETTFGTVVEVTCVPGYNITGNSTIICNEDGTWSDYPVCDPTDCGLLSVSNGEITYSQDTYIGSVATLMCNEGYSITASSIASCIDVGPLAAWNDSFNCDIQVCADPTPSNGEVINTDATDIYVFQNYAEIQCDVGYNINGDSVITCDDGGVWSNNPQCLLIDCGALTAPINGNVNADQGTKYNAEIQFSCHSGHLLVGAEVTKCGDNGEWSNAPPTCFSKSELGGSCINKEYCLLEGAICVNNICKCSSGIFDTNTNKCDIMPMMPYGAAQGDYVLPKTSRCGPKITFQPGFPIKNEIHTDLYVCRFGYISFDLNFQNPTPPKNKRLIKLDRMLLAPFYGPIDIENSGPVSYKTYDILNSYSEMKENVDVVSNIEMFVRKFGNLDQFKASFILIATWDKTVPFSSGFDVSKTSTFQVVLVSDGKVTYSIFIYGNGKMNWEYNLSTPPPVWVGNSLHSVIYTNPYAFTKKALMLDTTSSATVSAKEVSGLVFRSLNDPGIVQENSAVDCINWYNENYEHKKDIDYFASLMPECPCDIQLSRFDPWFWRIGLYRWRYDLNYKCVDMLPLGNFGQYGKSCCYDLRSWLLIFERPLAGSFHLYNWQYPSNHFVNDLEPKSKCCSLSNYCNLYYELRPTGSCYRKSPYKFGAFWGDPHFSTLDGLNFTFNGLGEYTLLKIRSGNCSFDLQARTERALKLNGNLADATIFTAFAAKDLTSSVHIERNKNHTGMNIYGNEVDLTGQYYENTDGMDPFIWSSKDGNLSISKRNQSVNVYFASCDISLSISLNIEMLTLRTSVQSNLKNLTQGLLGNYNDDISDDFTMPNGSILMSNITEKEIFQYGKTYISSIGAIDPDDSAFRYDVGKTHYDFHNDSYMPRFLEDIDDKLKEKAIETCEDSSDLECIFDFAFTENTKIAEETNMFKGNLSEDKKEIDETVPFLEGCTTLSVTQGEESFCKLTFEVGDTISLASKNVEAQINQEESTVSIHPSSSDPISVRVTALNKNGRKSPTLTLNIAMCTGCSNHGVCNMSIRTDARENEYFHYYTCECHQGYEGIDCETPFDGCAASPCSLDRNCTTLTPEEQQAWNKSYTCDGCPDGYIADGDEDCKDEDECVDNNGGCDQQCINTEGSFDCSCNEGYKLSSIDKHKCTDINECEDFLHNCSHLCNNTDGGFSCQCFHGYEYNGTSCIQISDGSCSDDCDSAHGCTVNDTNGPECFCNNGYELDETGRQCLDIDECSKNICPQDCVNTDGSYRCSCFTGYRLEGISTCIECESTFWGKDCEKECLCNGRGASQCHPTKGCVCESGWFGDSCDEDINECNFEINPCNNPRHICVNTLGSYRCDCRTGFFLTDQGVCSDSDECLEPHLNNCTQECINTFGSYSCGCKNGFTKIDQVSCKDINECQLGTSDCEQICVNNEGQYSCHCYYGYTLNDDRRTCSKIEDPCLSIYNLTCSHFCMLIDENAVCGCQTGYMLEIDNQTCTDVDECNDIEKNECDEDATCQNMQGSFLCLCPVGKQLENDGRTCTDCDRHHYGQDCAKNCSCLNGICDKKTGCICDPGWAGISCETDIDECSTGQLTCQQQHSSCVNVLGKAFCSCDIGFQNISGICQDINECSDVSLNDCDQICTNTEGSFTCSCNSGFIFDATCTDIDECSSSHNCDQICENSIGSYRCSCNEGYRLDLSNRKTCIPLHECSVVQKGSCPNNSSCSVMDNEKQCQCFKGFRKEGEQCKDIDECQEADICSQNCSNTPGTFICSCNVGFILLSDKVTCRECDMWTFGSNCDTACSCNQSFTERCDSVTGECICKTGIVGNNCDTDVNECVNGSNCPNNSYCENTHGSFTCNCLEGFFKTGSNECEECDFRHFGNSCQDECQCNFENTEDCHHKSGVCACKQGWEGDKCMDDVDECLFDTSVCSNKPWSTCVNNVGSFKCECNDGFTESNDTCEDIDECADISVNDCEQLCENIPGNFTCTCEDGYSIDNSFCRECIDETYGYNCSEKCVCEKQNTKTCNHVTGNCTCIEGWEGEVCSYDIDECQDEDVCSHKAKSKCNNTEGSYTCVCNKGFREENNACYECQPWTYGYDCFSLCTCNQLNTESCDSKSGECICIDGWNGTNCEIDINECLNETTCPPNSSCNNTEGSFDCICHIGYSKTKDRICKKCSDETYGNNCSEKCTCDKQNTKMCDHVTGNCTCQEGWEGINCSTDVNECDNEHACEEKANSNCNNTIGSYICVCEEGYKDGNNTCHECEQWTYGYECSSSCSCDQSNTKSCDSRSGECICYDGWNGTNCETDLNECLNETVCPPNSSCNNTEGSFDCNCNIGYKKTMNGTCRICMDGRYGYNCTSQCDCELQNTKECDNINGSCTCLKGWKGFICNEDINECEMNSSLCQSKFNSSCQNTNGSYNCNCNEGFREQGDTCTDCDEWMYGIDCQFSCSCNVTLSEYCDAADGTCKCKDGWDGDTCEEDIDECMNSNICPENSECFNSLGTFDCVCLDGFFPTESNACTDIDECTNNTLSDCEQLCENIPGSFMCTCEDGYTMENTSCIECIDGTFGLNCSEKCVCNDENTKKCDHVTGRCTCEGGWEGDICSIDKDECKVEHSCKEKANSYCNNTDGSYSCVCDNGYRDVNNTCGECEQWTYGYDCSSSCSCFQLNTNSCDSKTGQCICAEGWNGTNCEADINECLNETICPPNSSCNNTKGGFNCICNIGFTKSKGGSCEECIDEKYGYNCSEKCACEKQNTETCNHMTGNCTCKEGLEGELCSIDIDECKYKDACKQKSNSNCNNTLGSYTCVCDNGYREANNTCHECKHWTYGFDCLSTCSCNQSNTESCDSVFGECICKDGWNGTTCETDINECLNETVCPPNSSCNNTEGSFNCICYIGYTKTINDSCELCIEGTYGINCTTKCDCEQHNTKVCDHINGSCTCNQGWKGVNCNEDINECEQNFSLCQSKINSSCHNTNGSYNCNCNEGFREQGDICTDCNEWKYGIDCQFSCTCNITSSEYCDATNGTCKCKDGWDGETCEEDIDECMNSLNICQENSKCINSFGTFNCVCLDGFFLDESKTCSECENWTYGKNCLSSCSCNQLNTESCDSKTGQCICKEGWNDTNCETDINECLNETVCQPNSSCNNTEGSFDCVCNVGYTKTINETCEICGNNTYGTNCSKKCDCISENSASENQTCDTVTGQCKCASNWEGETCNMDFNECSNDSRICSELDNTTCVNTFGSYVCDCKRGFHSNNGMCFEDEINPTIKPELGTWIKASVVIEIDLPVETNIHAASVYTDIQNKLKEMLRLYFRRFTESVFDVIIIDIRLGSISTDFIITSNTTDINVTSQLAAGITEMGKGTQPLLYDGQLVNGSSDTFHGQDACQIFSSIGGSCGEEVSCKVDNDIPVCSLQSDHQKAHWELIIGLSAGGLFLIIVLALSAVSVRMLRRRKENKKRLRERPYIAGSNPIRYDDDGSDFYRNYKWQNGNVVDAGIRHDTFFKLPRYKTHSHMNFTRTFQSPFANSETSSEIRRDNWI